MNSIQTDAELIKNLGGPSKVAEMLGIDKKGGAQRVQNWMVRGIPDHMKVKRPELFMPGLAQALSNQGQEAKKTVATTPDYLRHGVVRRQEARRASEVCVPVADRRGDDAFAPPVLPSNPTDQSAAPEV